MKDRLRKRLPEATEVEIDTLALLLERYEIEPTVKNLDEGGFVFFDDRGRTARLRLGTWRRGLIYLSDPAADVVILSIDGMIAGWIESSKLEDLEDRFAVDIKSLSPLPGTFSFVQQCSHLVDHGGFYEGDSWECIGCGTRLVFNDQS